MMYSETLASKLSDATCNTRLSRCTCNACGWVVVKRGWAGNGPALMHNGSNTMWYLVMWLAPEKNFSVVVATNIAGAAAEKGCDDVAAAMIGKWLK